MDKTRKLRRYNRKDYTQVVDFPVEIVGRDGVVRRYSFEESIRLYQRRIASADNRYDDGDVASAEVEHCRRRIAQLRRSYFERYGFDQLADIERSGRPGQAGEVTAFLRRCLAVGDALRDLRVDLAGQLPDCRAFSVQRLADPAVLILYVYAFDATSACPRRDAFFAQVKLLQQVRRTSDGVECLVGFHHTTDLGLVLTGTGTAAAKLAAAGELADPALAGFIEEEPEPLATPAQDDAMGRLRRGDHTGALRAFVRASEADPYRRAAYLGAVVVADQLGAFEQALMSAQMGTRYFPDDPSLAYHLAVAWLRLGDTTAAKGALIRAQAFEADPHAVGLVRALIALRDGRLRSARRMLRKIGLIDAGPDEVLKHGRRRLRGALALVGIGRLLALLTASVGAQLIATGHMLGAPLLVTALAFVFGLPFALRAWARWLIARPGRQGIALASAATLAASGLRQERSQ